MNARILNVVFRGATLVSRFGLLFFLARYLSPAEVGEYGIVFASISYALFILGFDFYTYSTRELMGKPREDWDDLVKNHIAFITASYAVTLPLIGAIAYMTEIVPRSMIGWFILLLVLEHISQEFNRLLVSMSRPLLDSLILFVRSGAWVVACVALMICLPVARNLMIVFGAWACGGLLAIALGVISLRDIDWNLCRSKTDWRWIRAGLRVAIPLLVGTLASRVLFTLDRYFERQVAGSEILGAYTFYIGIANAILAVLDASVISIVAPQFVSAVRRRDRGATDVTFKEFKRATLIVTISLVMLCAVMIEPIVALIGREIYADHLLIFYILLASAGLFCISMIPHYVLYAYGADKSIIIVNISSGAIFIGIFFATKKYFNELSVPIALIIAFLSSYCGKAYLSRPFTEDANECVTR